MSEMEEKLAEMEKRLEAETNETRAARAAAERRMSSGDGQGGEAARRRQPRNWPQCVRARVQGG